METRNYDIVNRSGTMWSGLLAAILSTLGVLAVLLALGASIGLASIEPAQQGLPQLGDAGLAAGIWSALSIGVACFVGAAIGTMIAGLAHKRDATSFGFTTWAGSLIGLGLLGMLATSLVTPAMTAQQQPLGQQSPQVEQLQQDAQQTFQGGNAGALQRAVDATAATSGWFVVSSALGILGGVLGGLAARHKPHDARDDRRRRVTRDRGIDRDRYVETRDPYADRGVMRPGRNTTSYPLSGDHTAPPPRSGADYRHVRDVHDDGEAY